MKILKIVAVEIFIGIIAAVLITAIQNSNLLVLNPQGVIAAKERNLIIFALCLAAVVVIPFFAATIWIVWKYKASNKNHHYTPEAKTSNLWALVWWAIPGTAILIMSILNWQSTHQLDPFKPLQAETKPLTIQVVALQWRWLFIYPEQQIATLNYVEFPEKTPVTFELTADAPMNSFWIPQLGGQMYAMSGMVNKTHLMADSVGQYTGSDAEISGAGFASMHFKVNSVTNTDFASWVKMVQQSSQKLDWTEYKKIAKPLENNSPVFYSLADPNLYNEVVNQFMAPGEHDSATKMGGMH